MADSQAFAAYKPGQGVYARAVAAGAALLLILYGCVNLYEWLAGRASAKAASLDTAQGAVPSVDLLGLDLPVSALWAAGVFLLLAGLVFVVTFGPRTGIQSVDGRTHGVIDMLVNTEAELAKVSWPGRDELTSSTVAVLVAVVALGAGLYCIDHVVAFVMTTLKVLPK